MLILFVPSLAVSVRRLHDHGRSGFFYLLCFIPLIGWIIWIVLMMVPGTKGPNEYGEDPREPRLSTLETVFQ